MFANANFQTDGTPWEPSDFLGRSNRDRRRLEAQAQLVHVAAANVALGQIVPGGSDEGIPDWARGPYRGEA